MAVFCANSHILYREFHQRDKTPSSSCSTVSVFNLGFPPNTSGRDSRKRDRRRASKAEAFGPELSGPSTDEMEPITGTDHLDQILLHAQEQAQPILIDWMATWCRKCIYLKPKLEKLAAEYRSQIKFYYVDVNTVSQALVKRGNISKMPTIQVWKDGEMKEEVIGGHKAWLVVDEVRDMIRKYVVCH